jgi:hypothetical protein
MTACLAKSGARIYPGIKITAAFAALVLVLFLAVPGAMPRLKTAVERFYALTDSNAPEIRHRYLLARGSLSIFADSPVFGMGAGSVRQLYPQKQAVLLKNGPSPDFVYSSYSHNDYIQVLAETGIAGLALLVLFIFTTAASFERAAPFMRKDAFIFSGAAMSAVCFFTAESFFNFPLFSFPSCVLFYSFAGMAAACSADAVLNKRSAAGFTPALVSVLFISLLAVFLARGGLSAFASDFYLKHYIKSGDTAMVGRALKLDPGSYHALYYHARLGLESGDYKSAYAGFTRLLEHYPYSADMLYNTGYVLFLDGNHSAAAEYYKKALFLYPDFPQANRGMFSVLMAAGMEKEALAYLEKAVIAESRAGKSALPENTVLMKEASK